jgi:hypothetical protein
LKHKQEPYEYVLIMAANVTGYGPMRSGFNPEDDGMNADKEKKENQTCALLLDFCTKSKL